MNGKFIVIEGQGFTGKTTQATLLVNNLHEKGIEAEETREPGGVTIAEQIRQELLTRREANNISAEEEVKLFYQARKAFIDEFVRPSLERGEWIVSTRFSPSTIVYQGIERGVNLDLIKMLDREIVGDFKPDLYILLDASEDVIWSRMEKVEDREKHGYNEMDRQVINLRRNGYLQLAKENSGSNWKIIDANGSVEDVAKQIWSVVEEVLKPRN